MDRKLLIKNLKSLFCALNRAGRHYSEVWLRHVDYGGLYHSDQYILNVKADHEVPNIFEEMKWIIHFLDQNAHEESQYILRVKVYRKDEKYAYCDEALMAVFNEYDDCK